MPRSPASVVKVNRITDPTERARVADVLLAELGETVTEVARVREAAIQEMRAAGMTLRDIGLALGMSRSRAQHLAATGDVRDRARSAQRAARRGARPKNVSD